MSNAKPGDGLWGWLGRQIGHVAKAVKTDVVKPALPASAVKAPEAAKVIYRDEKAEEVELPDRPGVKLRRTVIDEVIDERKAEG